MDDREPCVSISIRPTSPGNSIFILRLSWSFETVRYFGSRHLEVKETGLVILRPRQILDDCGFESSDEE